VRPLSTAFGILRTVSRAHAIPLPRIRRRRPPTPRQLLGVIWIAICLTNLAHNVMVSAAGDWYGPPLALLWVGIYLVWRRMTRAWARLDELGIPMPGWELRYQCAVIGVTILATTSSILL
jgi:hypothetical protein